MAEEVLNLYQKLAKIRAISDVARKDKRGYNYTYTDLTTILAKVTAGMKKYGVSLIPSVVPSTAKIQQNVIQGVKYDKTGKRLETLTTEMLFATDMLYTWVNDENPEETIPVPWFATASMSDASQSVGAAMSYTLRQFLTSYFQIAQSDNDVDEYRSKQKEAEEAESREVANSITDKVLEIINNYLEQNPGERDSIVAIVKKYAKSKGGKASANPKDITDSEVAAKLLEEVKQKCGIKAAQEE